MFVGGLDENTFLEEGFFVDVVVHAVVVVLDVVVFLGDVRVLEGVFFFIGDDFVAEGPVRYITLYYVILRYETR